MDTSIFWVSMAQIVATIIATITLGLTLRMIARAPRQSNIQTARRYADKCLEYYHRLCEVVGGFTWPDSPLSFNAAVEKLVQGIDSSFADLEGIADLIQDKQLAELIKCHKQPTGSQRTESREYRDSEAELVQKIRQRLSRL